MAQAPWRLCAFRACGGNDCKRVGRYMDLWRTPSVLMRWRCVVGLKGSWVECKKTEVMAWIVLVRRRPHIARTCYKSGQAQRRAILAWMMAPTRRYKIDFRLDGGWDLWNDCIYSFLHGWGLRCLFRWLAPGTLWLLLTHVCRFPLCV